MKIIIIAAMNRDRVIGRGGQVPWRDPADLKHFKQTTMGHAVIMGRKTFDSIVKPLAGRRNIVITRNAETPKRRNAETENAGKPAASGTTLDFVSSLEAALELCRQRKEETVFIAGGGQIYEQAIGLADEMIITYVEQEGITGDTYFPAFDPADWKTAPWTGSPLPGVVRYVRAGGGPRE
jgi:dihydrofolate reductase